MFAASKTATPSGGTPDPQFNYVTMLLHGDGTNGAQNNTFLDSSSNNFTITRNGNTTQGSFSPYGSNWSINNGSANGNGFQFSGTTLTGDFTMEAWVFATPHPSTQSIVFSYSSGNVQMIYFYPDGRFGWYRSTGSGVTAAGVFTYNTWNHVAAVRSSGVIKLYLNGVDVGLSISDSSSVTVDSLLGYGGSGATTYNVLGYVSNARVTDTVVYSGNFTPSTTPLTAISGTRLLTFQSNRFIDNSSNNFAFTIAGTPSVQRFNPFGASTAYSTSVIGGSGYFDGSGDYLTGTGSSNLAFGSGDFTIELWFNINSVTAPPSYQFIYSSADSSVFVNTPVIYWYETSSSLRFNNGADVFSIAGIQAKTWYHVAIARSGTTTKMFLNGAQVGSATDATVYINQPSRPMIGANGNGSGNLPFNGYISDVRCVKGTALYTTAFTPPTAPLTAVSNTQLLLNMTNGAIFDNAMMNDLETVGNAQISTSVVKYGTGSLAFDETGDYITVPPSPNMSLGTGDFTIECWVRFAANPVGNGQGIYQLTNGYLNSTIRGPACGTEYGTGGWTIYHGTTYTVSSTVPTTGVWYHTAYVRSSGTSKLYIDGTSIISVADTTNYTDQYFTIGGWYDVTFLLNGYIDDLRITKGYARYTANFTPPTAAFPNTGPI